MNTKRMMLGVVVVVLLGGSALRADITYYFVDYPEDQIDWSGGGGGDVWTLSGFITTDGTQGELAEENILEWMWRAEFGGEVITARSTAANANTSCSTEGIWADTDQIKILPHPQTPYLEYSLTMQEVIAEGISYRSLGYFSWQMGEMENEYDSIYYCEDGGYGWPWTTQRDSEMFQDGRVIAEVPEPGTFILCVGALCVGLAYAVRRRRSA